MANNEPSGSDVEVQDSPENSRFEARIDGGQVGLAAYALDGGVITFTHTEVNGSAEGKGVGSALARTALDSARSRGLRVVPRCEFIAGYISRHEEYLDLVPPAQRELVQRQAG